jgi:hypothetical protein
MTPEELKLLQSINDNLGFLVKKFSAHDLDSLTEIETEDTEKPNSELLLEGE